LKYTTKTQTTDMKISEHVLTDNSHSETDTW